MNLCPTKNRLCLNANAVGGIAGVMKVAALVGAIGLDVELDWDFMRARQSGETVYK